MSHFAKSLRVKVTLVVIAVELLIFSGAGVFYTHRFSQEIDNAVIARLSIPGLLMTRGELSFDAVSDKRTMEGLLREPYSEGVVIGLDGQVYFSSDPARLDTRLDVIDGQRLPSPESSSVAVDAPDLITSVQNSSGTYLTCLSPLRPNGKLTGYLYLKVGTEVTEAEKRKVAVLFAIGSLATIIFTAAILTLLLHWLVNKRLNYLVEVFRRFALGNYATRAQVMGGGDEIATLMNGFNGLAQRLEEAMANFRESEQRYRLVFENSPVSIWEEDFSRVKALFDALRQQGVSDFDAYIDQHPEMVGQCADQVRIVAVNRAALDLHAAKNETDLVAGLANTFTPESFATFRQELRCLWNGVTEMLSDAVVKTLAGEPRHVTVYFSVCPGYEETLSKVIVSLVDITERKRTEDALRFSSERLQLATRVANIGIWDWDVVKNELLWDDSMYLLYGIRREDFGEAYDAWIRTVHPEDKAYTDGEIQAALRGEHEYGPEFRIVRPDGSIRFIKADSQTFKDKDGKPVRMIGTNIDITERKRAEDELKRYRDNLEETVERRTAELRLARDAAEAANKAKSGFLANMSHELRTPLNAILGFSGIMRRDPQLTSAQIESLDIINRSGEHLLALINDVLEMAKIEAGRAQLEIASFDLGGMVRDVTDMMRLRAELKGLFLQLDQTSEFPRYIRGDEARLRQILVNLVGNAVKFTHTGGVMLRLGVKQNDRQHLLIEIEDSGPGIRQEDQERIFRPFVQLEEGAEQKGTGLGLTITKQFIDLMGGRIEVESTVGKGSLFRVEVPVELADFPSGQPLEQRDVVGLVPGQPAYRILIVEDQKENQLLLTRLMSTLGLESKVAEDGEQCLRLFQEWHPDLIWMDRRMPVMDGLEATQRIRRLPDGGKVKIVAVTASAFKEQKQEMFDAGMDDFVSKPYRFGEIYDCLARQLGLKYLYRAEAAETEGKQATQVPETLSTLPASLRQNLRDALECLDREQVMACLDQIGKVDADLAAALSRLAKGFDYPAMLRLLDETGT
ncbi:MAG TPA: ATP-binding protein [Rhodocyclaceae bacterium]|nr:ATP-binding protein [Rhodocyclaceae bacterium]